MNWVAFFSVIGGVSLFACLPVGIEYSMWEYPSYHKFNRNWLIGLFIVGVVCLAIAAGLGNHK